MKTNTKPDTKEERIKICDKDCPCEKCQKRHQMLTSKKTKPKNKPSKKTEWEKARKEFKKTTWSELTPVGRKNKTTVARHTTLFNFYWSWIEKELIPEVLHQRDNEIREWASKNRVGYTAWFRLWGQVPDQCKDNTDNLEEFLDNLVNIGYTKAIDDLLTYLSNRED